MNIEPIVEPQSVKQPAESTSRTLNSVVSGLAGVCYPDMGADPSV